MAAGGGRLGEELAEFGGAELEGVEAAEGAGVLEVLQEEDGAFGPQGGGEEHGVEWRDGVLLIDLHCKEEVSRGG